MNFINIEVNVVFFTALKQEYLEYIVCNYLKKYCKHGNFR